MQSYSLAILLTIFSLLGGLVETSRIPIKSQHSLKRYITNGQEARRSQFPYQIGLRVHISNSSIWCGGTLISDHWIVTAAHCVHDMAGFIQIFLGAHNRHNNTEKGQQIMYVNKNNVIIHERFNHRTLDDDIALIRLPAPVQFNEYIQPARLPKPLANGAYDRYERAKAFISGWGRTTDTDGTNASRLRWARVPIMSNEVCRGYWNIGDITPANICADTSGGISICSGDSGGPLILADRSRTLIGIPSFVNRRGCQAGIPAAFTRITNYLDWIENKSGVTNKTK